MEIHTKLVALCAKKTIKLGTIGIKALESHAKSSKHAIQIRGLQQTRQLFSVLPPSGDVVPAAPPPASQPPATAAQAPSTSGSNRPPTTQGRIDLALGSTPTLVAEVLWTLETVVKHQSYNSNEGIGKLFARMFPD